MSKKKHPKILVLGDIHTPFADMKLIKQAYEFNKKFKANIVICTGDMLDQKAFSRYPKEPEDDGPATEWNKAVAQCKEIEKLFPKMTILSSNHDIRFMKKASDSGLPGFMIKTIKELVPCKGWRWQLQNPLLIDDIAFIHGDEYPGAAIGKAQLLGKNLVQGHTHQANIYYKTSSITQLWALDVGCMVDPKGAAFNYAASNLNKIFTGFGYIENNVPYLVPKKK